MAEAEAFYAMLLPALGFHRRVHIEGWLQFESGAENQSSEFFGVTESAEHRPNECRVAFWAASNEEVDRLTGLVRTAGGRNLEGPLYEGPGYYALFFEDPSGNRLEICHRAGPSR